MEQVKFALPKENPLSLISYLKKYSKQFWLQAVTGILYNTVIVAGPIMLGRTIDAATRLQDVGVTPESVRSLIYNALAFLLVTMFFQYCRYLKRWYLRDMTNRIAGDMRSGLFSRVLGYPMEKIDRESVGDLMSRTVGDVEEITATTQTTINETWDTWLLMISYFVVLLYFDWRITLICAIPTPIAILAAETVRHPLYRYSMNARKSAAVVSSHLQKTLNGLAILRLFGREGAEKNRLKDFNREQMGWSIRTNLLQTGMMPVYASLASLGIIGVIGLGAGRVVGGIWTIGRFTAYLTMFTAMATRTWVAARTFNRFHAAKAAWDRIKEKLGEELPQSEELAPTSEKSIANPATISVENLSFTFPGSKRPALENVSFEINRGDFIGVTGPVGAGKSALASVLTGIYPYSGRILVDGEDLKEISNARKSKLFTYSGQDAFLFSASIGRNITFTDDWEEKEVSARLNQAVFISALSDDISLFPQGLKTVVGERGVRVSGGQRQRIALARAIFTGNPVLILDDPFSAVDIGTERRMIERIRENLKETTVIIFSHRLASFTGADNILVLDTGRLAECGTHGELMQRGGIYRKIYSAQEWMEEEGNEPE